MRLFSQHEHTHCNDGLRYFSLQIFPKNLNLIRVWPGGNLNRKFFRLNLTRLNLGLSDKNIENLPPAGPKGCHPFSCSFIYWFFEGDQPSFTEDSVGSNRLGTTVNSGSSLFKNDIKQEGSQSWAPTKAKATNPENHRPTIKNEAPNRKYKNTKINQKVKLLIKE